MAARTKRIKLGTGAVILPWNLPIRIAEKVALLDILSERRMLFGMGRGLARREYVGMGIDMDESRDRFDESAAMVLKALVTSAIEGQGPLYPQVRTEIRPRPTGKPFVGRTYSVAMSPDSVQQCAKLGAKMVIFAQRPWEAQAVSVQDYRTAYKQHHGADAPPIMICDFTYCDTDPARAKELGEKYVSRYLVSVLEHYELMGDHLKDKKGYESYGAAVDFLRAAGKEAMCQGYLEVTAWGTPEQIIEKFERRRDMLGDFDINPCFRFGGMSFDEAERSMRAFATHVMPKLRRKNSREAA